MLCTQETLFMQAYIVEGLNFLLIRHKIKLIDFANNQKPQIYISESFRFREILIYRGPKFVLFVLVMV